MEKDLFWGNIFNIGKRTDSLYFFLKSTPLFKGLTSRDIKNIEKIVHLRKFKEGEIVFKEDEPGTGMYLIKSGSIRIAKQGNKQGDKNQEDIISTLMQHDFLGELALIEETSCARTASAYADHESELVGFFKPDLMDIIQRNPRLGVKIVMRISEIVAARLRITTSALTEKKKKIKELEVTLKDKNDPRQRPEP